MFRTLTQPPFRAQKRVSGHCGRDEEPWNARDGGGQYRRRRRRRLRFGQEGQLAAKEGDRMWGGVLTAGKILGLIPAGELGEEHTTAVVRGPE